ncbi:MAG: hypothetical protein FD123_3505 [Bacteroidetes bacterium]|nr:MAG: hypothetical protein FD123_3505 [Bacteroidota bacterium]
MKKTALFLILALAACNSGDKPVFDEVPLPPKTNWQKTELYFGLNIGDTGRVDTADFARFIDTAVTRRFPDGFSIIDVRGHWFDASRKVTVKEPTKLLVVIHEREKGGKALDEIAEAYKMRFHQQSVLRFDYAGEAKF